MQKLGGLIEDTQIAIFKGKEIRKNFIKENGGLLLLILLKCLLIL